MSVEATVPNLVLVARHGVDWGTKVMALVNILDLQNLLKIFRSTLFLAQPWYQNGHVEVQRNLGF